MKQKQDCLKLLFFNLVIVCCLLTLWIHLGFLFKSDSKYARSNLPPVPFSYNFFNQAPLRSRMDHLHSHPTSVHMILNAHSSDDSCLAGRTWTKDDGFSHAVTALFVNEAAATANYIENSRDGKHPFKNETVQECSRIQLPSRIIKEYSWELPREVVALDWLFMESSGILDDVEFKWLVISDNQTFWLQHELDRELSKVDPLVFSVLIHVTPADFHCGNWIISKRLLQQMQVDPYCYHEFFSGSLDSYDSALVDNLQFCLDQKEEQTQLDRFLFYYNLQPLKYFDAVSNIRFEKIDQELNANFGILVSDPAEMYELAYFKTSITTINR